MVRRNPDDEGDAVDFIGTIFSDVADGNVFRKMIIGGMVNVMRADRRPV